jgi:HEPN domain-containing protein
VRELTITKHLKRPANFIVHSLADVNKQLKRGRPFFLDIVSDGIAVYEAPGHPFVDPAPLSDDEARKEAQGYFDEWFPTAGDFFDLARVARDSGKPKPAAFLLHQVVERLYHCTLLVLTLYAPRAHKLDVLRSLAEGLDPRLIAAWPRDTRFNRRGFDRIRRAYIEARYSPHYRITDEELTFALERTEQLQGIVRTICQEQLAAPPPPPA